MRERKGCREGGRGRNGERGKEREKDGEGERGAGKEGEREKESLLEDI